MFQAYNLVQELTAYENILLPVLLDNKKPDETYLSMIIELLGIGDRLDHLPSALSGGQQQPHRRREGAGEQTGYTLCGRAHGQSGRGIGPGGIEFIAIREPGAGGDAGTGHP